MNFSTICRTCMKNNNLNPIFISEDNHERFTHAIYLCTGVKVKLNDGLPQNMCTPCMNQFNNTLKFRKQCKEVETQLLKFKNNFKSSTNEKLVKITMKAFENTQKNISNITDIKSECDKSFNVIKNEPTEIEMHEEMPLKYMIHENTQISTEKTSIEFNEEIDFYDSDMDLKIEKQILKNNDSSCEEFSNEEFETAVYSRQPQKKVTEDMNVTEFSNLELPQTKRASTLKKKSCNKEVEYYSLVTENRVVCKLCQKELSIRSIDTHMAKKHPGVDERKVKCELCDKFIMKEKLNRHRIMMHGSVGVKCGYCKTEFSSKEELLDHVRTCTAKKRKRTENNGRLLAECDICNKTMQRASLKKHIAVAHAGLRPVCEHCGKGFGNKFRLNEHCRAKHGYEKFQCSYCDFRSAGIMSMRNHERRHRGEKPFVCDTCGAKFHAAYLLMQHKHSHKTEKLVKCDQCPATFKANNNLHMHKLTCHSKSVHRCNICSRTYKCRYYAVKHVRVAHNITGAPPVSKLMA